MLRIHLLAVSALLGAVSRVPAQFERIPAKSHLEESEGLSLCSTLVDIDQDGVLELLAAHGAELRIWENDGAGVFVRTNIAFPSTSATARCLAVCDTDGDGDLDVLASRIDDPVHLRNDGAAFVDATGPEFDGSLQWQHLDAGDVDGDGDVDVVLSGFTPRLLVNDGVGNFADVSATQLPFSNPLIQHRFALEDVDADGDLDLVFLHPSGSAIYTNDGLGTFTEAPGSITGSPEVWRVGDVVTPDVDGDGDPDIVAAGFEPSYPIRVWANDSTGVFTEITSSAFAQRVFASDVDFADLDGDGDQDLVTAPDARVLWNDGSGIFTEDPLVALPGALTGRVSVGDVDGDGDVDLLFAGNLAFDRLWLNDGSGVFVSAVRLREAEIGPARTIDIGDVDGDGQPDAVVSGPRLLMNSDQGAFHDQSGARIPEGGDTYPYGWARLADLRGDGVLQLLASDTFTGSMRSYENVAGSGYFQDVTDAQLPAVLGPVGSIAVGDITGDGFVDLVLGAPDVSFFGAGLIGRQNRVLRSVSGTSFVDETATRAPAVIDRTAAVELVDVDGDQDLDLLVANDGQNRLWQNDGSGVFVDVTDTALPFDADDSHSISAADVDGDGDVDFVAGNFASQNKLYLNDGSGTFQTAPTGLPVELDWTWSVRLRDLDRDGDPDLVVTRQFESRATEVLWNDGGGVFAASPGLPPGDEGAFVTYGAAIDDVDLDGDLDIVSVGSPGMRILSGLDHPQLTAPWVARLGYDYRVEVRSALPSIPAALFLGFALAPQPIATPFGELALDPATTLSLGVVPNGRLDVPIGTDPVVVGLSLVWQGLGVDGGGAARLTNVVVDRVAF